MTECPICLWDIGSCEGCAKMNLRAELISTMKHARIFITSREKMHPAGVDLYDKLLTALSGDERQTCPCGDWDCSALLGGSLPNCPYYPKQGHSHE